MNTRRNLLATLAAFALALVAGSAPAAPPRVEILAMAHPPVKMALAPLRNWLATRSDKLKLVELDIESPPGAKRLAELGLGGHIPIVILIDGQFRYRRKDGVALEFVNFPAIEGAPPGARGNWTTADVQAALSERIK